MIRLNRTLIASAAALALLGTVPAVTVANTAQPQKLPAKSHVTRDQDNLWNLAAPYERGMRVTRQQWMVAVLRRNPDAFLFGNMHRLKIGVTLDLPTEEEAASESLPAAEALIEKHFAAQNLPVAMPTLPLPADGRPRSVPSAAPEAGTPAPAAPPVAAAGPASAPAAPAAPPAPVAAAPVPPPGSVPASAAGPASSSAPAAKTAKGPASAAASAPPATRPEVAAAPAATAQPAQAPEPSPWRRWLPQGLALLLGLGVLGLVLRARSRGTDLGEAASTFFQDTIQLIGKSKPKVITVSQAGADVARSVERLSSTAQLVRPTDEQAAAAAQPPGEQEASIKLEVARAQWEVGRKEAAIAMLRAVLREGSAGQRHQAEQLLGQFGAT